MYDVTILVLRVVFTLDTMSTVSSYPIASFLATQGKSILLSASVGFVPVPESFAGTVFSCANPRPTMVLQISLLTVCHVCTNLPDVTTATTVSMLWTVRARRGVALACSEAGVK